MVNALIESRKTRKNPIIAINYILCNIYACNLRFEIGAFKSTSSSYFIRIYSDDLRIYSDILILFLFLSNCIDEVIA